MTCMKCMAQTRNELTNYVQDYDNGGIMVIRHVPCSKCPDCGAESFSAETMAQIDEIIECMADAAEKIQFESVILDYAKL